MNPHLRNLARQAIAARLTLIVRNGKPTLYCRYTGKEIPAARVKMPSRDCIKLSCSQSGQQF